MVGSDAGGGGGGVGGCASSSQMMMIWSGVSEVWTEHVWQRVGLAIGGVVVEIWDFVPWVDGRG